MNKRRKMLLIISIVTAIALVGCSGGGGGQAGGDETAEFKDTLTVGINDEPVLDPWLTIWPNSDIVVSRQIYDPLFRDAGHGEIAPGLAKSYEWIDETHIKLELQEGIKFHDGSDFTSKDVMYWFENLPNNARAQARNPCFDENNHEIVDDHTIILALKYPFVEVPQLMARMYMPSSAAIESMGVEAFISNPVGTGPYTLEKWDSGSQLVLKRFEDYWGGPNDEGIAATENLIIRIIPDDASRIVELETGGIDMAFNVGTANYKRIEETDGLKLVTGPSYTFYGLTLAMNEPLFENKDVRYALSLAIDMDSIVEAVYNGYYTPMDTMWSELLFGTKKVGKIPYDPEKAKELMVKAGYPNGFKIKFQTPTAEEKQVCEAIQAMWAEIGVETEIIHMSVANYEAQGHPWQAAIIAGTAPNLAQTLTRYQHDAGTSLQAPSEGKMGDLALAGNSIHDPDERLKAVEDMQDYLFEDRHMIPIANAINAFAMTEKVDGFVFDTYTPYLLTVKVQK